MISAFGVEHGEIFKAEVPKFLLDTPFKKMPTSIPKSTPPRAVASRDTGKTPGMKPKVNRWAQHKRMAGGNRGTGSLLGGWSAVGRT